MLMPRVAPLADGQALSPRDAMDAIARRRSMTFPAKCHQRPDVRHDIYS